MAPVKTPEPIKPAETSPEKSPLPFAHKTISIKNLGNKNQGAKDEDENLESKPRTPFDAAQLERAWLLYADKQKSIGRLIWHSMLIQHRPRLLDDFKIEFILDHNGQKPEFENHKQALVTYLRQELQNWGIQVIDTIRQVESDNRLPMTSQEKFDEMARKNPALLKLRDQFKLDLGI